MSASFTACFLLPGGALLQAESIAAVGATQRIVGLEEGAKTAAEEQGIPSGNGGGFYGRRRVEYHHNTTTSSSDHRFHGLYSVLACGKDETRDGYSVDEGGSGMPCNNSNASCSVYDAPTVPLPLLLGWLHTPFALGLMVEQDTKVHIELISMHYMMWVYVHPLRSTYLYCG